MPYKDEGLRTVMVELSGSYRDSIKIHRISEMDFFKALYEKYNLHLEGISSLFDERMGTMRR